MRNTHRLSLLDRRLLGSAATLSLAVALSACSSDSGNNGGTIRPKDAGTNNAGADGGSGNNGGTDGGTGNNGGTDGGTGNTGFDGAAVARSLAAAQCAYYERCEPAVFEAGILERGTCAATLEMNLETDFTDFYGPLLAAGRVRYQADRLTACIAELGSVDCDLGSTDDSPCNDLLVGTQPTNGACHLSAECATNTFCSRPSGFGTCGTCAPAAARGASCEAAPCVRGAICVNAGSEAMPMPVCVPNDATENGACLTLQTGLCRGSLQCVGDGQMAPFTCRRPAAASAACDPMQTTAADCNIYANLICDQGTCKTPTWGDTGSMCGGTALCGGDSYCPTGGMTCSALPLAGASCADVGVCGPDAYCDAQGNCAAVKPSGGMCTSADECQGELSCLGAAGAGMCGMYNWMMCN